MSEIDDSITKGLLDGIAAVENRLKYGSDNDNRPPNIPHLKMIEAQGRFARAKTLATGVRHLQKCARELDRPHSFTQRGARQILSLCDKVLAAIKANESPDVIGRMSLALGDSWGQLRTRASV